MNRRDLLKTYGAIAAIAAFQPLRVLESAPPAPSVQLSVLEAAHGGRLGVAVQDTGSGRQFSHRGNGRFLMCSTFKLPLVAAVLMRVDRGEERLDRRIVFGKDSVLDWAPVTGLNAGAPGMTIEQLCEATAIISDNTASSCLMSPY